MSGPTKEWLVILMFFSAALGITIVETLWVAHKGWASFAKSFLFSFLTNAIGFFVGLFVMFAVLLVIMAMAWDGSLEKFPLGNAGIIAFLVGGALFFPILLALLKRLLLKLLKIQTGKAAWIYSFASSFLIVLVSLGAPVLLGFILFR